MKLVSVEYNPVIEKSVGFISISDTKACFKYSQNKVRVCKLRFYSNDNKA